MPRGGANGSGCRKRYTEVSLTKSESKIKSQSESKKKCTQKLLLLGPDDAAMIGLITALATLLPGLVVSQPHRCPTFYWPRPLSVQAQGGSMVVVLAGNGAVGGFALTPAGEKYTPLTLIQLARDDDRSSNGTVSRTMSVRIPSSLGGAFMLVTTVLAEDGIVRPCSGGHAVLLSIVSARTLAPVATRSAKPLEILSPRDGERVNRGAKVDVFLGLRVHISKDLDVCFNMRDVKAVNGEFLSCWPASSPQPFRLRTCGAFSDKPTFNLELCNDGPRVLHVWLQHHNGESSTRIASQKVIFDVDTSYSDGRLPTLHLVTPQQQDRMWEDSVWLKVEVRPFLPTRSASVYTVCALVDHTHQFCHIDPMQPHQLQNLEIGEHMVTVWLENASENISTKDTPGALSHTFWVEQKDVPTAVRLDKEQEVASTSSTELSSHPWISSSSGNNKAPTKTLSFCIIVFAFARPLFLSRLWDSLLVSDFTASINPEMSAIVDMKLIIDRPSGADSTISTASRTTEGHAAVLELAAGRLQWPHGKFDIVLRDKHYGIRDNVLSAWIPGEDDEYDRAIFLEDDVVVSPFFFQWLIASERDRSASTQHWVGVSLYRPKWNEIRWTAFDHEGPMLLQLPCSWGAMYTSSFWLQFIKWWQNFQGQNDPRLLHTPRSLANEWGEHSWKQALLRYMVEQNAYLLYPSRAFSTTGAPNGVHVKNSKALRRLFDVPLVTSKREAQRAISFLSRSPDHSQKIPKFNYLHSRIADSCQNVSQNFSNCGEDHSSPAKQLFANSTTVDTKISCHSDSDTASCVMHSVGLRGTTFLASTRTAHAASTLPFIVPSYRHRCCLEDVMSFSLQPIPPLPKLKCDRQETRRVILMGAPRFGQYGHTLHDFCMSLFAHVYPYLNTGYEDTTRGHANLLRDDILVLMANKVDQVKYQQSAVDFGVLSPLLEWAGVEYFRPNPNRTVCFDSITVGPSPQLNLYSSSIEFKRERRMLRHFVAFARQQLDTRVASISRRDKDITIHVVLRSPPRSRQLLNANTFLLALENSEALGSLGAKITAGDFVGMSLREQVAQLTKTDVMVAVLGTALLNAIFLPDDAAVVFLSPYGTNKHMGQNMRRAVSSPGNRALLEWHATDPLSSVYAAQFADANGHHLKGAALVRAQREFARKTDVDSLWRDSWLDAFAFYVNCKGITIDISSVVTLVERGALRNAHTRGRDVL